MANKNYEAGKVTIQHEYRFTEIEYWNEFQREKQAIQDKYPSRPWETYTDGGRGAYSNIPEEGWWEEWCSYKKEIADLMLDEYGNFSKFLYEIRPARDTIPVDVWMRGKYNTEAYMKTRNRNKNN